MFPVVQTGKKGVYLRNVPIPNAGIFIELKQKNGNTKLDNLKAKTALLPTGPGVYQFLSQEGKVIYVGKAKNLRSRVSSYFTNNADHTPKVKIMVRHITDIRHIVVETESDALLLENNLIKEIQPRYNIMLKDAKSYPWICLKNEPFPRIFSTRRLIRDGSEYFGPYSSVVMQNAVLELIRGLYPLRTCKLNLSGSAIVRGKYSVCLQYHIGNCLGPCEGRQSAEDYETNIAHAREILRGDLSHAADFFQEQMTVLAANLKFEEADWVKHKLQLLENYRRSSIIVSPALTSVDAVFLLSDDTSSYCNHMKIVHGAVVGSYTFELRSHLDESPAEVLSFALSQLDGLGREVIVPLVPADPDPDKRFTIPRRGDKLKLLGLSERNCKTFRLEKLKQIEITDPDRHTERIMERMRKDLNLTVQPRHIECFDNSNIQGSSPVASCVVFRDGKPCKKDYRHFNIKTVTGANDFASMEEVVFRRYNRMLSENQPLPQLIVIDGGKGQLGAAVAALERLGMMGGVTVTGLAKRMEELYFPGDPVPHYLDKNSETLRVLMQLRDEAHRFGITFHRQKRSLAFIKSELENIPSLGKTSVEKLLRKYRTVSKIRNVPVEELSELIGRKRAEILIRTLNETDGGHAVDS